MENKLPEDFKKRWVEALRSGEYKQCRGKLHGDDGGHCCLGVADIVFDLKVDGYYLLHGENVPSAIRGSSDMANRLAAMNDGNIEIGIEPHSFFQIADYIEKNL